MEYSNLSPNTLKSPGKKVKGKRTPESASRTKSVDHISTLINTAYFFLQNVFILVQENSFRLVVLNNNHLLLDREYKTMRGARVAFLKFFGHKAWKRGIKCNWTPPYIPDAQWLHEKTKRTMPLKSLYT